MEGLGECALSDEPDPRCPAVEPSCPAPPNEEGIWGGCQARVCDGTRAKLTCVAGYVIDEEVCGTYELCKEAPSVTSCAPPPDPRCPDEGTRLRCDGNLLVTCGGGLSEEEDALRAPARGAHASTRTG